MANWMADEAQWSYNRQLPSDMPDWLKSQYSWIDDEGGGGRWTRTGLQDAQGQAVVQTGAGGQNLYQDEGVFRDPNAFRLDPNLGYVTDASNWDGSIGKERRAGREKLAQAAFLAAAGAGYGYYGLDGAGGALGGAGTATDIAPGYLAESVAPQVTEAMAGSPFGGNSLWQSAMNYATSNPLSAARGVAGLLGAAGSAGGSQQTTGASGGFQGPPVGQFNPVGNAGQFQSNQSQYQPMQFDPVPFMGGSMYYNQQQPNFMGSWGGFNPNAMNFGGGYTPTQFQGGGMPAQSYSNGGFGGNTGGGMGYAGGGPNPFMSNPFGQSQQQPTLGNNQFSPVGLPGQPKPYMPPQFNMNQQQPQQGGLLGNVQTMAGGQPDGFGPNNPGQNPHYGRYANNGAFVADPSAGASQMDQSPLVPGMTNREVMGYARYLPGNKSPLDPLVSQNLLQKSGGNWQSMVPQRAQAGFQQFMNAFGNPQSFGDYQNFLKAR